MPNEGIQHYRTLRADSPFSLADLEAFCTTLRAHGCDGETKIHQDSPYTCVLTVRIDEPLLTPTQLQAVT